MIIAAADEMGDTAIGVAVEATSVLVRRELAASERRMGGIVGLAGVITVTSNSSRVSAPVTGVRGSRGPAMRSWIVSSA